MASIFRKPGSPFYFAAFRDALGLRRQRSTKLSDRSKAMRLALEWERLASAGRAGMITEAACRKVVSDLHEQVTGSPVVFYTIAGYFDEWLANCEGTTAPRTLIRYKAASRDFMASLGDRAKLPLSALTDADVRKHRDAMRTEGRSVSTCNQEVKILRMPLSRAVRGGYIAVNPAAAVSPLKEEIEAVGRAAFSLEQLDALLKEARGTDWEGCVLFGAYCGLRLMDAANLTWQCVDLQKRQLNTITAKRGTPVLVPLHPVVVDWLNRQPRGIGKAPIMPSLHGKRGAGKSGLSMSFKRLMGRAGVVGETARAATGKGRTTSTLSFHSTRHFFVSALGAAGVGADTRQRLAGHTDDQSHRVYSKHEVVSLRDAIEKLPSIGGRGK